MLHRFFHGLWAAIDFMIPRRASEMLLWATVGPVAFACFFWAWVDVSPVADSHAEVVTPVVEQGGTFTVRYDIEWARDCRLQGWRAVIDSQGVRYDIEPDERYVVRGNETFSLNIPVPLSAAPGPAVYRAVLIYECNPWQRFIAPLRREVRERAFLITAGQPTAGGLSFLHHPRVARVER